ncbi:response regulator transcription factor [Halioxenophilus aromaticivorans]|uniref:Response regulator n=1 Tax=Halioxenophilus aromaticivorans TaxID=1306992 RepID=A0AAV3UAU6_9ALTE
MRILLVEDDQLLGESLAASIKAEGYSVDWFLDGKSLPMAHIGETYDLAMLDQRLPGRSGVDIIIDIRARGLDIPVLMLTAADASQDKVAGLDAGADDYLTKPFDMDELFARVRSLLRRNSSKRPVLICGEVALDCNARTVSVNNEVVEDLTAKEYAILEALMRNKNRFITKARLLETSSSWQEEVESNTVEVYISRLRKRFGKDFIETMRGVGYRVSSAK